MKNNWKDKLKEELYQFDVSSIQVTVLEYFIESLLEKQKKELIDWIEKNNRKDINGIDDIVLTAELLYFIENHVILR